jgi:uncharacterized protein
MTEKKVRREKEEQYFAHQELLKRKALRDKLDLERQDQKGAKAKHPHWMKCPKCGGELEEIAFADVMLDKCKGCAGIYLDAGELELLIGAQKAKGFFSKFMEAVGGSGD